MKWTLHCLGYVHLWQGDIVRARGSFAESLTLRQAQGNRANIAQSLIGLAGVAAQSGEPERAARWYSAADSLRAIGDTPQAALDEDERHTLALIHAALDPATFASASEAGRALPLDGVTSEALTGE